MEVKSIPYLSATHTPYSDPKAQAEALAHLPADPRMAAACWRGLIAHYRVAPDLPAGREDDKNARWVLNILEVLTRRSDAPLNQPRPLETRFIGCCRDYALTLVATLRQHGVPARIRIGWAPYFSAEFTHDHVVAEWHDGVRWVRGDPELEPDNFSFDTMNQPAGTFQTAGEAWLAYRAGRLDTERYGVAPGLYGGPPMLRDYVLRELAALTGHELLLWDNWGQMDVAFDRMSDAQLALLDEVAQALAQENPKRWQELAQHPELRVPDTVQTFDFEGGFQPTSLRRR